MKARYKHTNIVARDWRLLADFYAKTFGCIPVRSDIALSGEWLAKGVGIEHAELTGAHLLVPGHGENGPTLEIFQYHENLENLAPAANRIGFGHIAFEVDEVAAAAAEVIQNGGSAIGEVVSHDIPGAGVLTFIYVADPEGNIIELQSWQ